MRNNFRIVADGKEFVGNNTVKKAIEYWVNGYSYAAYIAVMGEGHRLDKKAEVVSYNDNINKGKLQATYSISISEDEFPYKITSIGFAPFAGAELSNECKVDVKSSQYEIYGTVYLETTNKDFNFYPDQNPLVQSLLGMNALQTLRVVGSNVKLANGRNAKVDLGLYQEVYSRDIVYGQTLNIDFGCEGYTDFLIMCGDTPCARFNFAHFTATDKSISAIIQGGTYVNGAITVDEFKSGGDLTPYQVFECVSGLYESNAEKPDGLEGYELFCDPLYKYAALKNGSEFYVIDTQNFRLTRNGNYQGELFICSNGEVVSVHEGKVSFLTNGIVEYVKKGQTIVNFYNGGYDIYVYDQGTLYTYRYDNQLVQKNALSVALDGALYKANEYSVVIKGDNRYTIYTVDGILPFGMGRLTGLSNESVEHGCFYGDGYMGSYVTQNRIACEKASGRFCISDGALYYVGEGGEYKLRDQFDFDSATVAGGVAIFLRGGKLEFYQIANSGVYVSAFVAGEVSYVAKLWNEESGIVVLKIE